MTTRVQLSLYVPEPEASVLETARCVLDPIQRSLFPAHVTLCREDELAQLAAGSLASRLANPPVKSLTLHFGKAEWFPPHAILLPCISGEDEFRSLREHILNSCHIKHQAPHITLAHPRNPKATGNTLANAYLLPEAMAVTFTSVNLIEQSGSSAWRIVETFGLHRVSSGSKLIRAGKSA